MQIEVLHPLPSLATTAAAVAFGLFLGLSLATPRLYGMAAVVLLSQISISALNDWADRDRDAIAGRQRPIPLRLIRPGVAMALAIACAMLSLLGGLLLSPVSAIGLAVGIVAGWSYDLWLKPTPFSLIPFAIAFPLLPTWVGLVVGRPIAAFGLLIAAGAPLAVAIHVADSLPDLQSDRQAGIRPLPVVLGPRRSMLTIVICLVLSAVLAAAGLRSRPWIGGLILLASVAGSLLVLRLGTARPALVRWIAAGLAIAASAALLPSVANA